MTIQSRNISTKIQLSSLTVMVVLKVLGPNVSRYLCFCYKLSSRLATFPHVLFLLLHLNHAFPGGSVFQRKLTDNLAKLVHLIKQNDVDN